MKFVETSVYFLVIRFRTINHPEPKCSNIKLMWLIGNFVKLSCPRNSKATLIFKTPVCVIFTRKWILQILLIINVRSGREQQLKIYV